MCDERKVCSRGEKEAKRQERGMGQMKTFILKLT
jgi:hypothetical protein